MPHKEQAYSMGNLGYSRMLVGGIGHQFKEKSHRESDSLSCNVVMSEVMG